MYLGTDKTSRTSYEVYSHNNSVGNLLLNRGPIIFKYTNWHISIHYKRQFGKDLDYWKNRKNGQKGRSFLSCKNDIACKEGHEIYIISRAEDRRYHNRRSVQKINHTNRHLQY